MVGVYNADLTYKIKAVHSIKGFNLTKDLKFSLSKFKKKYDFF